jgi:D-alanyl-D-alanine carboxypeptidase (penicillin-binding protein 5/6)
MESWIRRLLIVLAAAFATAAGAQDFSTKAKFAVLMDYESGTVLFDKDGDKPMEPASMAKLMTVAVVFEALRDGKLSMDDEFFISENAWRTGGAPSRTSTMFAELNSKIKVSDLLRSVIIQSGNDAAIAIAEGMAGDEITFARIMNQRAKAIGLTGSNFTNSTGLPDPDMYVTARDLAVLARYIIATFPEYYPIFSEPSFEWNKHPQPNRNSLLEMGIGVDGLKTGHTEAAGYGTVVSTTAGGRRLIAVLHGLESESQRAEEGRKLVTWGTRAFDLMPLFRQGSTVGYADVYGGAKPQVMLVGKRDIDVLIPKGADNCPSASIVYQGPLQPPVEEGTQVASLEVVCQGKVVQLTPLFAGETVGEGDIVRKSMDALKHLALGWM